ncbi:MAG: tripartite tricarboxylate transporter TctB family protein [Desulfatiglandaceae bacterium]
MKRIIDSDVKLGMVLLLFCILLWFFLIPTQIRGDEQKLYPRFTTFFIAIPSLILLFRGIRKGIFSTEGKSFLVVLYESRYCLGAVGLMVLYAVAMSYLGYYSSSFLAVAVFMIYLGERRPIPLLLTPVAYLLVVNIVIERILNYPLPEGFLF